MKNAQLVVSQFIHVMHDIIERSIICGILGDGRRYKDIYVRRNKIFFFLVVFVCKRRKK